MWGGIVRTIAVLFTLLSSSNADDTTVDLVGKQLGDTKVGFWFSGYNSSSPITRTLSLDFINIIFAPFDPSAGRMLVARIIA
jgi:hypothetical protein